MNPDLLKAIETSNVSEAVRLLDSETASGKDPREIRASLFAPVQRVLNPPFINPHLPKMYRICRELAKSLDKESLYPLVRLEITEYAKRPKLEPLEKGEVRTETVSFGQIETALTGTDPGETAGLMYAFWTQAGGSELARRMLLLGSGYLGKSLGHSISCTAFIFLEAIERHDQDPWPALAMIADYFHRGRFSQTPHIKSEPVSEADLANHLLRAASGRGIINLHHTITLYAIERVRQLFNQEEYNHLLHEWIDFLGDKEAEVVTLIGGRSSAGESAPLLDDVIAGLNTHATLAALSGMLGSDSERSKVGQSLIRGIIGLYQGDYNPHYLTGLGSALWALDNYAGERQIVLNAFFQYLDYFYSDLKS